MFGLFKKKKKVHDEQNHVLGVDFHSHLIPGIDDGVKTMDQAIDVITELVSQGTRKIITTPHIINDLYPNTKEIIKSGEADVKKALKEWNLDVEFEASAEYYMDEWFIEHYETHPDQLLTFSNNHLLVETNYIDRPFFMEQTIFDLKIAGYKVILAHPERYHYLLANFGGFEKLKDTGVLFQINLMSMTGHYGPDVKKAVDFLIEQDMVDMVGSDIHKIEHAKLIGQLKYRDRYYQLMERNLLNNQL